MCGERGLQSRIKGCIYPQGIEDQETNWVMVFFLIDSRNVGKPASEKRSGTRVMWLISDFRLTGSAENSPARNQNEAEALLRHHEISQSYA